MWYINQLIMRNHAMVDGAAGGSNFEIVNAE